MGRSAVVPGRRAAIQRRARRLVACGVLTLAAAGCAAAGSSSSAGGMDMADAMQVPATDSATMATEIAAMLQAGAQAWNRGDLDAFLADYSDDPLLAFVGESGVMRGKASVRESYRTGYFEVEGEPDDLAFDQLTVRPLGPGVALALGRYTLFQPGFENQTVSAQGYFTLIVRREADGRWRIIHDHSS